MTFGIIARADSTGLGVLGEEFVRNLDPEKVLGIDLSSERKYGPVRSRLPERTVWTKGRPSFEEISDFLADLDSFLTFETEYYPGLFALARDRGVRSVLVVMPEYLVAYPKGEGPDLYVNPTPFLHEKLPDPKMILPVPIAFDRLEPNVPEEKLRLVHSAGRIVGRDRNGTRIVEKTNEAKLLPYPIEIRSQTGRPGLDVEVPDYWRALDEIDVLILPRRYGGLCLPMQEASARGIPTILLDVPNYREMSYPSSLLVTAFSHGTRRMRSTIVHHFDARPRSLAARVKVLLDDPDAFEKARGQVLDWARARSWESLRGWWESIVDP